MSESNAVGYASMPDRAPNTAGEVKVPQVELAITDLYSVIAQHDEVYEHLEKRLGGVLRNEPTEAKNPGQDSPTVVPVAARVHEGTVRLKRLLENYTSLLRRLEV